MKVNTLKVIRIASEINQMNSEELQILSECISKGTGEAMANYISFNLQDKDLLDIEVQDPVC